MHFFIRQKEPHSPFSMFAKGFPDSCRRSSEAFVDAADVKSSGAAAGAADTGAGAEFAGAGTPKEGGNLFA